MKRALRIVGWGLGALVLLLGTGLAVVAWRGIPNYEARKIDLKVEVTPERVARGERFAKVLCAECHMNPTTKKLTGKQMLEAPAEFGPIFSRNITKHPTHGIGSWTDGELAYLLRTGVARDGRYIPPYMAKLPHLADEDLYAIIAFLRSDSPLVEAAAVDPPGKTKPSILTKLLANLAWKPLPYPEHAIASPNAGNKVELGRYLVTNFECWTCHSADFKTINPLEPEKTPGFLGGGNPTLDLAGRVVRSANLTFDETGIGSWSEADFVRAMHEGVTPKGKPILYPMGVTPEIEVGELSAIYAYLKTVPKIHNPVARATPPQPVADGDSGKQLYYKHACYGCHGDDGIGNADLRQASQHYPDDASLIAWIKNAPSIKPGTRMPKWEGVIPEGDFAPLAAYVRKLSSSK